MRIRGTALPLGVLCLLWAFAGFSPLSLAAGETSLLVAAAADLYGAFVTLAPGFERETGIKVTFSFSSTGSLAHQIEYGAPFDLFFAADRARLERLMRKGRILPDSLRLYARGRLALATSPRVSRQAQSLADLARSEYSTIAIPNPDHAPYGQAAREALVAAGLWEGLRDKLVYAENVRQAQQFVETGNAQAGILAVSLVRGANLKWVPIEDRLHQPIDQAAGIVAHSKAKDAARKFLDYVAGPEGRKVLKRFGYILPGEF